MLRKKIISIMFIVLTTVLMVGCGSDKQGSTNSSEENVNIEESADEETEKPPISIEQIKVDMSIGQPDNAGRRYVSGTLTNNSNMPIRICKVTVRNTKINEDNDLIFKEQTILPTEMNSKPIPFLLKSGDEKNLEIIKYDFTLTNRNGYNVIVKYDPKSKTYDWH